MVLSQQARLWHRWRKALPRGRDWGPWGRPCLAPRGLPSAPRLGHSLYLHGLSNLYHAWHLCYRYELILLPRDGPGLLIASAEVSSLLQMPREKWVNKYKRNSLKRAWGQTLSQELQEQWLRGPRWAQGSCTPASPPPGAPVPRLVGLRTSGGEVLRAVQGAGMEEVLVGWPLSRCGGRRGPGVAFVHLSCKREMGRCPRFSCPPAPCELFSVSFVGGPLRLLVSMEEKGKWPLAQPLARSLCPQLLPKSWVLRPEALQGGRCLGLQSRRLGEAL